MEEVSPAAFIIATIDETRGVSAQWITLQEVFSKCVSRGCQ